MTTFLLIRHGMCDPVGQCIAGRKAGVHLNQGGREQAERLAQRLKNLPLVALYSSPLERALETASPIGRTHGLRPQILEGFNEIDFGEWTGRSLAELDQVPTWRWFNTFRSGTRIPGGENIMEVLSRALRDLERVRQSYPAPGSLIAVVSHGDVLRAVLAHALGLSLDFMLRIELSPASISILSSEEHGYRVLQLNGTDGWPDGVAPQDAALDE